MTLTYGFYNSLSGDRVYDAEDFGRIFDGIIADGIFQSQGGGFGVTQDTGSNMNVKVDTGRAWLNGTWTFNDAVMALTVGNSDPVLNRIDTVIIEVDASAAVRANDVKIIAGTPASTPIAPTLTDSGTLHQHPLCNIYVGAGVTAITNANITNRIGTDTPFCTGILETLSVAWLFANWEEQFQDWFDNLVDQLTGVQVTNLQNQIDAHGDHWPNFKNKIINGDMQVAQRSAAKTGLAATGYWALDRWRVNYSNFGTWTYGKNVGHADLSLTGHAKGAVFICTAATPSPASTASFLVSQRIESQFLWDIRKGTTNAKKVTISFWVKSNVTGSYIVEIYDATNTRHICKSFNINAADTLEKKELTFDADVLGSQLPIDPSTGLEIIFWMGAGSTYTSGTLATTWAAFNNANRAVGQVNVGSAVNNYFFWTGVQLEVGDRATEFEFLPYDFQLQRCLRYYQKSFKDSVSPASGVGINNGDSSAVAVVSSGLVRGELNFAPPMRDVPTLTGYNPIVAGSQARDINAVADCTATSFIVGSEKEALWQATLPGGAAVNDRVVLHWTADAEL